MYETLQLAPTSAANIPPEALGQLAIRVQDHTFRPFNIESFHNIYSLDYGQGDKGYVVIHPNLQFKEEVGTYTYLLDVNSQRNFTGWARVCLKSRTSDPELLKKLYITMTETSPLPGMRQQGLGYRRLRVMAGLVRVMHGMPLHSDVVYTSDSIPRMWERLVEAGAAIQYTEQVGLSAGLTRYRTPKFPRGKVIPKISIA